jgi:DNA-binding CsgD family transcriptional regulator/tetratricopeptide (TPR) repeat protein
VTVSIGDRDWVRARINVAMHLAVGNGFTQAERALEQIVGAIDARDDEITALYFQARAIARIKAREIDRAFELFEQALAAARNHDKAALCAHVLTNYGTAALQDGSIVLAMACFEEGLQHARGHPGVEPYALVGLAEAFVAAGKLQQASELLHELNSRHGGDSTIPLIAATVGIPLGMLLDDEALLAYSSDPSLLDLAFARSERWLLGPLVESFCALYEHRGQRHEHDALLNRDLASLPLLDNSVPLAIRAARLGAAAQLPRLAALMAQHCAIASSTLPAAYHCLFESCIAVRRGTPQRAANLARHAAGEFARAGRPLLHALALDIAGLPAEARRVRAACGGRVNAMGAVWNGTPIHKKLATMLTPREDEVARLAAGGAGNRTIAARLGISERTVHHHCESIFAKLGVRSRWQLTPWYGQFTHAPRRQVPYHRPNTATAGA